MIIIAGLGNPGEEYEKTPHNAGFEAVDYLAKKNGFGEFEFDKFANALVSKKDYIAKDYVVLAKPQTFMNSSGLAIGKLVGRWQRTIGRLIVIHDDIDLPLGEFRVSKDKGSAGHKGVDSVIKELGTKDFTRIRIGICPDKKPKEVEKYVLKKFSRENKEKLAQVFEQISLTIASLFQN